MGQKLGSNTASGTIYGECTRGDTSTIKVPEYEFEFWGGEVGAREKKLVSNLMAQEKSLAKVEEKRDRLMTPPLQQQKKVPRFTKSNSRYWL